MFYSHLLVVANYSHEIWGWFVADFCPFKNDSHIFAKPNISATPLLRPGPGTRLLRTQLRYERYVTTLPKLHRRWHCSVTPTS